ncbi:protealysin inhibitor emfourin [Duganella guangzhouensis]|nr:protealysin inhibitor emfourin [Duganella guangzhouensis]
MRLTLTCTGGFAGPAGAQTRTVDLAQLPQEQASQLEQLLHASDFFALPPKLIKEAPKSWDFQYDLKVDGDGQAHCVRYHLDEASPSLKQLTEKLNEEVDPD